MMEDLHYRQNYQPLEIIELVVVWYRQPHQGIPFLFNRPVIVEIKACRRQGILSNLRHLQHSQRESIFRKVSVFFSVVNTHSHGHYRPGLSRNNHRKKSYKTDSFIVVLVPVNPSL